MDISRETFIGLDDEKSRALVIFDLLKANHDCTCNIDERLGVLEKQNRTEHEQIHEAMRKRKKADITISGASGFFGGFVAMLGKWWMEK